MNPYYDFIFPFFGKYLDRNIVKMAFQVDSIIHFQIFNTMMLNLFTVVNKSSKDVYM